MRKRIKSCIELDNCSRAKWALLFLTFAIIATTGIFYTIWGEKYIYQDGAGYFYGVLFGGRYMTYPIGRSTAHILQQLFIVHGYKKGITDVATMGLLMGFGYSFWIYLFWGCTLLTCRRYKRLDLAEYLFIYLVITVLFIGFFSIIESTVAASLYCYEMSLYLLHKDERKVFSVIEMILMVVLTAITYHFNEYYVVWSLVLATVLLYRIWIKKELSKYWSIAAVAQLIIAVQSKLDMAGRGEDAQPKLIETLSRLLQNKQYFGYVTLIVLIGFLAHNYFEFKGKTVLIVALHIILTYQLGMRVYHDSTTIAVGSYPMRFTTFGWGICLGIFILVMECAKKRYLKYDLLWLCLILSLITAFFNRRTGHELRDFHSWEVGYCYNHPGEGYIPIIETGFQGSAYNADWIGTLGSFDAEILRGFKTISSVIDLSWSDDYGRLRRDNSYGFDRYGIIVDYDALEANPQVDFEEN